MMKLEKNQTFYRAGKKVKGDVPETLIVRKSKDSKKKKPDKGGSEKGGKP